MDPVRAVDVAAEEVLEPVVAVEPATPLTELGDPRPDVRGVRADGDGPRRHHVSLRKQGVAGEIRYGLAACPGAGRLGDPRDHRASPARAPQTAPSFSPHARALTSSPSTSGPSIPETWKLRAGATSGTPRRRRRRPMAFAADPETHGIAARVPKAAPDRPGRGSRTSSHSLTPIPAEIGALQAGRPARARRDRHPPPTRPPRCCRTWTRKPPVLGTWSRLPSRGGFRTVRGTARTVGVHRLTRPPAEGPDAVDGAERGWSSRRRPGPMPPRPDRPGAMSSMPDGHTRHGPNVVPHPGTSAGRVGSRPARGSHGGRQSEGRLENPRERREIVPVHIDGKRVEFTTEIVEQVASRLLIQ